MMGWRRWVSASCLIHSVLCFTQLAPPFALSTIHEYGHNLRSCCLSLRAAHQLLDDALMQSQAEFDNLSTEETQKRLVRKGNTFKQTFEEGLIANEQVMQATAFAKVPGCVANVQVRVVVDSDQTITLQGHADALVSRGLLALIAEIIGSIKADSRQTAESIRSLDPENWTDRLGLRAMLSPGRNDGVASLVRTIQKQIDQLDRGVPGHSVAIQDDVNESIREERLDSSTNKGSRRPTVGLLLSGGVDSSVALNLLIRQGYDVTAFYLKIWLEDELAHLGQCPWEDDYRNCQAVCEQAGIPLETISLQESYQQRVIQYTIKEAEQGRTPNPDIMCNSRVKFGCFYDAIQARHFDHVASGHYARVVRAGDVDSAVRLLRAPDPVKDQSYFLCALTQDQLDRVLFPIGHMEKFEVRELAKEFQLPNRDRPDSQGLCFLGKVKFDDFLKAYLGERPGEIVDAATGDVLGRHKGVWYHTVGQRRGIGKVLDPIATSRGPWYVVAKNPKEDVIYCSNQYDEEVFEAARSEFAVENIHWIAGQPPPEMAAGSPSASEEHDFTMKIRHGPRLVEGSLRISRENPTEGDVRLKKKDGGLAPGQFVVFYLGEECLGSGVISEQHWTRFLTERHKMLSVASTKEPTV